MIRFLTKGHPSVLILFLLQIASTFVAHNAWGKTCRFPTNLLIVCVHQVSFNHFS